MTGTESRRTYVEYWHSANQILTIFAVGLACGIYGPSLLDLAEIYGEEANVIAIVNSTRAIGTLIGSIIGGYLYSSINDQVMLMVMLALSGITTVCIPLLSDLGGMYSLHVIGFVAGGSIGIFEIGSQVRLVRIWRDKSASALQAFHTAFGVGAMVAPFIGAPFLSVRGEDNSVVEETRLWIPYAIFGVIFILIFISMLAVFIIDPANVTEEKHEDGAADPSKRTFEMILVTLLFWYLLLCVNTEVTYSALLSVYAVKSPKLLFTKSDAAYLTGIFWTTFTGGRAVSIFTAVYFNLLSLLWISHVLLIVSSVLLVGFSGSVLCTWIGTAILGLGLSSLYGAASGYCFDYFIVRHFHLSVILVASCLGVAVSSYFVPPVVDAWPMFLQWYTAAGNLLHFFVLIVMICSTRGRPKVQQSSDKNSGGVAPSPESNSSSAL